MPTPPKKDQIHVEGWNLAHQEVPETNVPDFVEKLVDNLFDSGLMLLAVGMIILALCLWGIK